MRGRQVEVKGVKIRASELAAGADDDAVLPVVQVTLVGVVEEGAGELVADLGVDGLRELHLDTYAEGISETIHICLGVVAVEAANLLDGILNGAPSVTAFGADVDEYVIRDAEVDIIAQHEGDAIHLTAYLECVADAQSGVAGEICGVGALLVAEGDAELVTHGRLAAAVKAEVGADTVGVRQDVFVHKVVNAFKRVYGLPIIGRERAGGR